ncbi:MAG: hypothetical protein J0M12_10820 [Deltaproteobacteria bacterium]|nr:hypothetical protein [Deltaproteobacteria bacterium]
MPSSGPHSHNSAPGRQAGSEPQTGAGDAFLEAHDLKRADLPAPVVSLIDKIESAKAAGESLGSEVIAEIEVALLELADANGKMADALRSVPRKPATPQT